MKKTLDLGHNELAMDGTMLELCADWIRAAGGKGGEGGPGARIELWIENHIMEGSSKTSQSSSDS